MKNIPNETERQVHILTKCKVELLVFFLKSIVRILPSARKCLFAKVRFQSFYNVYLYGSNVCHLQVLLLIQSNIK